MNTLCNVVKVLVLVMISLPVCMGQDDTVQFKEMVLDEPATSLAMAEDGKHLIFTHQAAHYVTIYDVVAKRVITTVPTLAPRSVICRGDEAYVANYGEGTVSILSRKSEWKKINDVKLPESMVVHLSAPRGSAFQRKIIAACRSGSGPHENKIYLVDLDRDESKELGKSELAEFSADGRMLLIQALLRNDGFGGLAAYSSSQLASDKGLGEPTSRGGSGQTPYVYQVASGSYWYSQSDVFGGTPTKVLHSEPSSLIVPDWTAKRFYVLGESIIKLVTLDTSFKELDSRRVVYPDSIKDFSRIWQHRERQLSILCDQPCAYVHDGRLYIFVLTAQGSAMLSAETAAFQ